MRARDDRVGLNIRAPTVNLLRHPLWGRNEEGYSEDPKLTSAIATAYTRGLRGTHPTYWLTAPVLKHWLAHDNETDRATASSSVRPRVLHEYDLRAFRETVEAGATAGVMPAYNLVNGRPNHVSPYLREYLRAWTDEELLVCSDAGAPSNLVDAEHYFDTHEEATAAALLAGVDSFTDHGTDGSQIAQRVRGALEQGLLTEAHADDADLPALLDYDVIGGRQTYLYFEGTPLFPFGHGLSYASFSYGDLTVRLADETLHVSFTITNIGDVTADEVPQLYTRAADPSVPRPRRELVAHRRVTLAPGERAELSFEVPLSSLEFWDVAQGRPRLEPGSYELMAGASSEDVRLRTTVVLDGEPAAPRAVLEHALDAADFDEQRGIDIVDRTKARGDAVTGAPGRTGELVYRSCDFGAGATAVTVSVAGEGTVEISLDGGPARAVLTADAPGSGPYDYTTLGAAMAAEGVQDVHLRLRGALRLAHVGFSG